jgi:hypothetical protein
MPLFRVRDLTINVAAAPIHGQEESARQEATCDNSTIACFNAASIHPAHEFIVREATCDNSTIACFNAASIHPRRVLELIGAVKCDDATIACFNAASVHPNAIIRAAVPMSAASEDLAALKTELRDALARLDSSDLSSSEASAPRTLADVEMLQRKLSDALDDLNARRQSLQEGGTS